MKLRVFAILGWLLALAASAAALQSLRADSRVPLSEYVQYGGRLVLHSFSGRLSSSYREEGRVLYETHCSNCHGAGGTGGRASRLEARNLPADDHSVAQIIRRGLPGGMPAFRDTLTVSEMLRIVAYLRAAVEVPAPILTGDATRGSALFFGKGKCGACHVIEHSEGGALGPDLRTIGRLRGTAYLREKLIAPQLVPTPQYRQVLVETLAGTRVSGVLLSEDTFSVQFRDPTERVRSFRKDELASYQVGANATLMPGYREIFSDDELNDLVAYLAAQGR